MKQLANLKSLQELDIGETEVGDIGLTHLCELPNLTAVTVTKLKSRDRGVAALCKMKSLKQLTPSVDELSKASPETIERALPECMIIFVL